MLSVSAQVKAIKSSVQLKPLGDSTPSGYGLLWMFLDIVGLCLLRQHQGCILCLFKLVFVVLLVLTQVFFMYCCVTFSMAGVPVMPQISNVSVGLISMALWFSVSRKKIRLDSLIFQIHSLEEVGKREILSLTFAINACFAVTAFIKVVCTIGYICNMTDKMETDYATAIITTKDRNVEMFIRIILSWLAGVVIIFMPVLVTVLCSSLYFRCSQLLDDFYTDIHQPDGRAGLIRLSQRHRRLFRLTRSVERRLSPVAFMLFGSQVLNMFVGLSAFATHFFPPATMWQCVPSLTIVPATVLALTLSASRISSKARDIRASLQSVRHVLVSKQKVEWESVALVESMLETSFPTMTACRVVELQPKLILSVFGSLFTYGFLIINMK
ncbi:hypothetical protein JTE90_013039 [Oedothorax gibbosus]|uniref:Gustatory receptor n=1 Tax=Oedothorax gibbosus TaxID=931172 RepID=A0AAV6UHW9_9ARAC|nr:hypothetical protein JTE90_013039 [Oedothorax gibbosus]